MYFVLTCAAIAMAANQAQARAVWASHPVRGGDAVILQAYGLMDSPQRYLTTQNANKTFLNLADRENTLVNLSTWDSQSKSWAYHASVPVLNGSASGLTFSTPSTTANAVHTVYRVDLANGFVAVTFFPKRQNPWKYTR